VLERLSPAERVVFVLRHAFELPFEEIAPVVGRDVVTCRKIFSRARARVAEERPRFAVDRKRHIAVMEKFREAARGQDMSGLLQLLDENVVLHGDGGGKAFASKKPVSGRLAVAQFLLAVIRTLPPQAEVEELELNGAPALVVRTAGRISVAIMIDTHGDRIRSIFGVSNPDKLEAIARGAGPGPIAEIENYSYDADPASR
jgi:RNA polymerase sigma-70 factor (ECF subfamily)